MSHWRVVQRPFDYSDDIVAGQKTQKHGHACGRPAFDQDPTKIFEVLEERLYRAALIFEFKAFRFRFIGHGRNRSGFQALAPGLWGTVCCESGWEP